MVDTSNTFNSLNRAVALRNIQLLCPVIAPIIINTYRCQAELFVNGGAIYSREGTIQKNPSAMAFYAIAILPLIKSLMSPASSQVWFADDASAAGQVQCLRSWWDLFVEKGPPYAYFLNAIKSWLITKPKTFDMAVSAFAGSNMQIMQDNCRCLGAAIGSDSYIREFV